MGCPAYFGILVSLSDSIAGFSDLRRIAIEMDGFVFPLEHQAPAACCS
jgi:hypothetical protein